MRWINVRRIFNRELRDQLRDRRTLFTIAILPVLLYPLLGMTLLQVAQFSKEHTTKVSVLGERNLPPTPALLENSTFAARFCPKDEAKLLDVIPQEHLPAHVIATIEQHIAQSEDDPAREKSLSEIQQALAELGIDAVVYIPADFAASIEINSKTDDESARTQAETSIRVFVNSANDKSRIASDRLMRVFDRFHDSVVDQNLQAKQVTAQERRPFQIVRKDIASDVRRRAAIWSRILPFVVLVWALTGAFYPAIDLCAGEKERGTLETLLCSPAKRSEIVCGKLLTIMTFSMATSLLNLASMAVTGLFVMKQISQLGPGGTSMQMGAPPIYSLGWLLLVLIPISALFSALSLAVASLARSSKEGQYYLMPLLMVILPLLMLPMMPAAELNLGSSLIPITGMMLLLRSLIEGRYAEVGQFVLPVIGVTLSCCYLSIRWAVSQFNNESVLFRESERFGVSVWFRSIVRDRGNLPTWSQAIMCGILILVVRFFGSLSATMPADWSGFVRLTLITLIGLVAAPALLMAITLTRRPLQSLGLRWPRLATIPLAMLLACCLHPAAMALSEMIQALYPLSEDFLAFNTALQSILGGAPNIWCMVLLMALTPAICEELVFRGFILNGLQSKAGKWTAIAISSLFFGATHAILQQSLSAFVLGLVIGYIAMQTSSILPCIAYHFVHNALAFLLSSVPGWIEQFPILGYVFRISHSASGALELSYQWPAAILMTMLGIAILFWFRKRPASARETCPEMPTGLLALDA
jgi:sodium transport system permease protein